MIGLEDVRDDVEVLLIRETARIIDGHRRANERMEITDAQYRLIEHVLPTQRGNVSLANLQVLNAILYVAEQGCKWRGLPKRFGNWHTIYTRMNRWSKHGVLDRVFAELQHAQIVRIKVEAFNFTLYGLIEGKVLSVTRDAVQQSNDSKNKNNNQNEGDPAATDGQSGPVYMARIAIDPLSVENESDRPVLPPVLGAVVLASGVALLLTSSRKA